MTLRDANNAVLQEKICDMDEEGWDFVQMAHVLLPDYLRTDLVFRKRPQEGIDLVDYMRQSVVTGRDAVLLEGLDAPEDYVPAKDPLLEGLGR